MDKDYAEILLKKTKENYNLIAEDFSRTRDRVWEEIKFLFDRHSKDGERVLDLGCGNGRFFEFFKDRKIDYIGVDNSERLIEFARKKYPQTHFQIANALNLPFPDNFFDKIYSIAVFHHIPSEELRIRFLEEAKRVLKPGGLLILTVWKFHRKKEIFFLVKYTILKFLGKTNLDFKDVFEPWQGKINRYYHWFSRKELIKLLKKVDFKIKEIGTVENSKRNRRNIYLVVERP